VTLETNDIEALRDLNSEFFSARLEAELTVPLKDLNN
jgi:hypothetical protein